MQETTTEKTSELSRLRAALDIYRNRLLDYNGLLLQIHLENRSHQADLRREIATLRTMQQELTERLRADEPQGGLLQRIFRRLYPSH